MSSSRTPVAIDHQLLVELGLGHLDERQQRILQRRIYEVLELRVGHAITSSLTAAQRSAFDRLLNQDPEAAQGYLERVVPNYGIAVRREFDFIAQSVSQSVRSGTALHHTRRREQDDV